MTYTVFREDIGFGYRVFPTEAVARNKAQTYIYRATGKQ